MRNQIVKHWKWRKGGHSLVSRIKMKRSAKTRKKTKRIQKVKHWKWSKGGHSIETRNLLSYIQKNRSKEWRENAAKSQRKRYEGAMNRKMQSLRLKRLWLENPIMRLKRAHRAEVNRLGRIKKRV